MSEYYGDHNGIAYLGGLFLTGPYLSLYELIRLGAILHNITASSWSTTQSSWSKNDAMKALVDTTNGKYCIEE